MINFIICDDEIVITNKLKDIIMKTIFKTNINYKIHIFSKYDSSFDKIMNLKLENKIYILDIEVYNKSGLEIAKKIRENDWDSTIIILTSHYELESIAYKSKLLVLDFISKFDLYDKKISDTIMLCVTKKIANNILLIRSNRKYVQINYNDILYITYDTYKRKLIVVTFNCEYESNETLKNIKNKLKGNFIYTHKSCIVNMSNVKIIDTKNKLITFINNKTIYLLSRNYIKDVKIYANN